MKKPIIAISLDLQNDSEKYKYARYPWYALRSGYSDAVSANGGIPIMLPFDEDGIDDVLSIVDGLIIPGGDVDIDPKFYGEEITSDTVIINHERTAYDMKLLKKALEKKIPFLGICYGMQLLNVFLGGSLIQDIKGHVQPYPKHTPYHPIKIEPATKLAAIAGGLSCNVNSTHHQAVKALGKDLIVSAIAKDGIIEAVEHLHDDFTIGVEWHPEYLECEIDKKVYMAFIEAAKRYRR